jgi:hypothetical protein
MKEALANANAVAVVRALFKLHPLRTAVAHWGGKWLCNSPSTRAEGRQMMSFRESVAEVPEACSTRSLGDCEFLHEDAGLMCCARGNIR